MSAFTEHLIYFPPRGYADPGEHKGKTAHGIDRLHQKPLDQTFAILGGHEDQG